MAMKITAAGIDSIKIGNADGSGHGAQFVVWLYFQVDEGGSQTGQELVIHLPFDPDLTFGDIARQAFVKAKRILRAGSAMDEDAWLSNFARSLEPLPEWSTGPQ